ncbi:hypothetical protein ACRFAY_00415 [Bacteroides hominis]|uniref:hypothetical protein n=1 Tax=Bacteroides hominis TaxID=2763023 RepID=UPI001D0F156F|nr:hypothetical protein [Bacteroides hominis (ex Afrizal et al. 2022)]MCC2235149.1 hypothetical protein [Bacteroides hominis (ex Afrizal et al. 2022)]
MERVTIKQAKNIFGKNFIGPNELNFLFSKLNLGDISSIPIPEINYSIAELEKYSHEYILILGLSEVNGFSLSIRTFRDILGMDPVAFEPCFYNQDWYLKESFIDKTLENRWYLLKRKVLEDSRAIQPDLLLKHSVVFPSAILCTYTFFAYYIIFNELLWRYDFIWCSDVDHNGDRIYVGRYHDIDGMNKNGFSIHRHLALRNCYCAIQTK